MHESWRDISCNGQSPILIIADHASNRLPDGIALGLTSEEMSDHIAWDIGVAALSERLCERLNCPAILGNVSRLVIDFNREANSPSLVPLESDGIALPGNHGTVETRRARYWQPYHDHIAETLREHRPTLIVSLHSFTPQLSTRPEEKRPWEIGILYNQDERAARIAIPLLETGGICVGDQLPYSGKLLNATMNFHAEANGIAYLGIEIRQDLVRDATGLDRWAERLVPVIADCARALAFSSPPDA